MGIFQDDRPPPLYVPDLSKPAGAAVDADGNVTCVTCAATLPLARADVVGQGYRCPACTAKAELQMLSGGREDVGANLSQADRSALSRSGMGMVVPGGLLILGGIAVFAIAPGARFALYLIFGGVFMCAAGFGRMRAAG